MYVHLTNWTSDYFSVHADLLAKKDTNTDDIHKPPHSRESNQWKNNLGKETELSSKQASSNRGIVDITLV